MATGTLLRLQGLYYLATGLWPLASIRSFEAITGPKTDRWLVRMVALLATVIGWHLWRAGGAGAGGDGRSADARGLAVGAAAAFATVDVVEVARGTIRPVYLLDAAAEATLALALAGRGRGSARSRANPRP